MMQIEFLQPGMELHSDVHDTSGRLLARANTVLTDKHIKVLKTWGVAEANIKDSDVTGIPENAEVTPPSSAAIEQAEEIAGYLFSLANREHPAMQQLFDISVQHIAVKLGTGQK